MNRRTMIAAAVVALAVLALPAWEIVAPAYRQAHGCTKLFGVWWGVPEFDSALFCPWDINRVNDQNYVYRALGVTNPYDALRVLQEPSPTPTAKLKSEPGATEPEKAASEPEKQIVTERSKRQLIPAVQVCGPDHWAKDHWESSCR